ncbi:MAG: lipid asymmetry maintenance protein MlaB [Steroidobacteraceae bacterium]
MKQGKRKKSASAPAPEAGMVGVAHELPDAAYVEQLLLASGDAEAAVTTTASAEAVAEVAAASASGVIALPAQCLLRDAAGYRQQLLGWLQTDDVEIDVAAVERIDTAFMQVLLAFVRSRAGRRVTWLNVEAANSAFVEAAAALGLQAALQVPDVSVAA